MRYALLGLAVLFSGLMFAEGQKTLRVDGNTPGTTVADKITSVQAACQASDNCFILIDASLPKMPGEVIPSNCTNCTRVDYRTQHTHVKADITDLGDVGGSSVGFASGDIIFRASACSTGWTALTNVGAYVMLTSVAAGDAGTTGGSTAFTPAGTVASTFTGSQVTTSAVSAGTPSGTVSQPTFTGSALASHTHTVTQSAFVTAKFTVNSSGTAAYTSGGVVTTPSGGPSATLTPAGTVSQPTFTGSALGTHTHTDTAAGTVVSTLTGTAATIQPPYIKLIACKKD